MGAGYLPDQRGSGFLEILLWLQPEQHFRPNEGLFSVSIFGSFFDRFFVSILAHFVTLYGALGAILGPSWGHLGSLWGHLGPSWGHVVGHMSHLRTSLGHLGSPWSLLGPF